MGHKEDFDVVTAPDGSSALSITLACATVKEHYNRTTTAHSSVATDLAEVCSTGLRVYEGAQVLAAFMSRYGIGLVPPAFDAHTSAPSANAVNTAPEGVSPSPVACVVELGCGCGLVSFTLDAALRASNEVSAQDHSPNSIKRHPFLSSVFLIFTDASEDCLALVRQSGALSGRPVHVLSASSTDAPTQRMSSPSLAANLSTFRLAWSAEGVQALQRSMPAGAGGVAQLVLGSDLMYYRVDVNTLVQTAKLLLPASCSSPARLPPADSSRGFVVFAHFMRIPDGQRRLATIARDIQHMSIAAVPLTAFLDTETIYARGWNGVELVILSPHTAHGVCAPCTDTSVDINDAERQKEDVRFLKALLETRAEEWNGARVSSSACESHCAAASRQARAIAEVLQPYPSSALVAHSSSVGGAHAAAEEDAFLHLLL